MKIAIIIERTNIRLGGAERSVFELAGALAALGHQVTTLAAKGPTGAKSIRILCQNQRAKRTRHSTFAKVLKKYLAENSFDIVHSVLPFDFADVYQPRAGSVAESVLRNAASYQNNLLASYKRVTALANLRRTGLLWAEKRLCSLTDGPLVAALSQYVADQFKQHYGLDERRIVVIPNGVRTDKLPDKAKTQKLREQILAQLPTADQNRRVFLLFVANNFRLKGLTPLIKALSSAVAAHSSRPLCLIVAGSGGTQKYRHLARKLNVQDRIIFLGPVRHIWNILSISDVAVLPTFYDPSSRFILEALAADKPVITTSFNGASDLLVNDRHGKVIDNPQDTGALADAINYFTDPDNVRKASAAIAQDALREKISISRVAKQLQSLYHNIIEKRRQS
ncbi:MAG: glycosyltransferase family 4 protein [Planctomycetota bacterium]|jgi:UDP-glucose:(heptosyl)LPS alpha-1,3-glucosyltransferase